MTIDTAAILRVRAQAAARTGDLAQARQLRHEADRLDHAERRAYLKRFGACMADGFPLADAREQATLEAARVRRTGA